MANVRAMGRGSREGQSWLGGFLPAAAAALALALASQRLYAWPLPYAWEAGVAVTEWGHWLALACLPMVAWSGWRRRPLSGIIALLALAIAIAPFLGAVGRVPRWAILPGSATPTHTVTYNGDQAMDIYPPSAPPEGGSPCVLSVHGGSWARGSRRDFTALNGYLQQQGYLVAAIDYRLAPLHPYPAAPDDLERAYGYIIEHAQELRVDPNRVSWLGRSAGAHLVLLEAYRHPRARCVIAFYPPTDLTWSYDHPSNPRVLDSCAAIADFLGGSPATSPQSYAESSPLLCAAAGSAPTLLLHGGRDDLVYLEQSRRLAARLQVLGVAHEMVELPWANHGFDFTLNGPSGQISTAAVLRFLQAYSN